MKKIRYIIEAALLYILFFIFRIMPLDAASACGGWLGRVTGPRLGASRKALRNLHAALPGKTDREYAAIVRDMWDNLGRVIAEYPHLEKIGREKTEIVNGHILDKLKDDGLPGILFSAHMANWEVICAGFLMQSSFPTYGVYRTPNNPWSAKIVHKARSYDSRVSSFPKTKAGVRLLLQAMKDGHHVGILIDQKYNMGVAVPFFDIPAMTSPAFVQLCQKFKCPLVPARIERLNGARFRVTLYEPLKLFDDGSAPLPVETVIAAAHAHLENWIRERPEQWLWLHRRWDLSALQSS